MIGIILSHVSVSHLFGLGKPRGGCWLDCTSHRGHNISFLFGQCFSTHGNDAQYEGEAESREQEEKQYRTW